MHTGHRARPLAYSLVAVLMLGASATQSRAQGHDHPGAISPLQAPTGAQNALVDAVRAATARFTNVTSVDGPGEGYALAFGCVSGGEFGAMGLHYLNPSLVDGDVNPSQPEIILFEPVANGRIRITGADFVVPVAAWEQKHPGEGPPQLFGQLFRITLRKTARND